jgi:DNA primase
MAHEAIEQIKQQLDIVKEIGDVVALRRSGKAYKGLCPFHNERTPSFYVFPDTGTWRCFGCNEGGDIFTFVAKHRSLDFSETLSILAEKAGVAIGFNTAEDFEESGQTQARTRLRALNNAAAIWFHHQLLTSTSATYARSYLQSRGISNESIERFRLGYAPDGDTLTRYLIGQGFSEDEVIEGGLSRRRENNGTLYDYFRNRIIFTIHDIREQTVAFGARELGGGHPKYLNTPQTILFDKSSTLYAMDLAREAIRKRDQVAIVEGYVDALIAHQYGYRNTVACIGSAITAKHVQQIKKLTRRIVLALDPDTAGEMATLRAIEVAQEGFDKVLIPIALPDPTGANAGASDSNRPKRRGKARDIMPQGMIRFEEQVDADIRIMQLPDGVDPDEFIRNDPPAWEAALRQALPLVDFHFATLAKDIDVQSPAGKTEASRRLLPVIASIGDHVKRDTYLRQLAGLLHVDERDIQRELQRYRRRYKSQTSSEDTGTREAIEKTVIGEKYQNPVLQIAQKTAQQSLLEERASVARTVEEECVGLLLSNPTAIADVYAILQLNDFWGTETRAVYSTLASISGPVTPALVDTLLASLPEVIRVEAERLRTIHDARPRLERSQLARTAKQVAYRLKRLRLSEAITELSYLQRETEAQQDVEGVQLLRSRVRSLIIERQELDAARLLQT